MHAIIKHNKSIGAVLQYHQKKVELGNAEKIAAENFVREKESLSPSEVRYHFDRLSSRNERVEKNVAHIILSFDQNEKIGNEKMAAVASDYLDGMRFGNQPWLAYRHYDSIIPHAHLVVSAVREDGIKIAVKIPDLKHSRELTRSLEESYGLNPGNRNTLSLDEGANCREIVEYGVKPVYPAMKKALDEVVPNYAYTSLDELNAVLSLYKMRADEVAVRHDNGVRGLYYRPLADNGSPIDVVINAGEFTSKPTLSNLEERFTANRVQRESSRSHLTTAIDWCLIGAPLSLGAFKEAMGYEGISVVFGQEAGGRLQNCWFVDHSSRAVFEGATLGERFSAENLAARCIPEEQYQRQQHLEQQQTQRHSLHL